MPGNVPDALLLDEMFSPTIATDLAARGIDCRAVVTDPVLRALSDLEIFQTALTEGRVLVTNNVSDFESLRRAHEAAGNQVPGLIYTSDFTFPRTKAYMSRLAAALTDAATAREAGRRGGVLWLRPPGDSLKVSDWCDSSTGPIERPMWKEDPGRHPLAGRTTTRGRPATVW